MTNVNTAALREMLAKATPGEWSVGNGQQYEPATTVYCDDSLGSAVATCAHRHTVAIPQSAERANAALIAAAVNALPALLDNTDRLAALEAGMRGLVARMQLDLGAGKDSYTYTQYEQGRIAEKRKALHDLSALLNRPADVEADRNG